MSGVVGLPTTPPQLNPPLAGGPLRTYGRITDPTGARFWVEVDPDPNGFSGSVYLTALAQVLKLNYGESPFYGDWGLPAHASVVTQVAPDYYVMLTQQRFAPYFLALQIARRPGTITPTYDVKCQFLNGDKVSVTVVPKAATGPLGQPVYDQYGNPIADGTVTGRFAPI